MSARRLWLTGLAIDGACILATAVILIARETLLPAPALIPTGAVSGFLLRYAWSLGWRMSLRSSATRAVIAALLLGAVPAIGLWLDDRPNWDAIAGYQFGVLLAFSILAVREARKLADDGGTP